MQPETKLSKLRAHMEAGEWEKAIAIAARFPRLGYMPRVQARR